MTKATTPTPVQLAQLRWLIERGGTVDHHRIGRSRTTWTALRDKGLVEITGEGGYLDMMSLRIVNCWMSLAVTEAGRQAAI